MSDERQALAELREALGPEFDIKRRLGVGSTSTVYQAWEPALDRFVAIKVMHPEVAEDEVARKRFERAAKAVASLDHRNVARVHRFGRFPDEKTLYLVMQQVNGRTMRDRLAAEGPLPPELAIPVLEDVLAALAEAHSHGIVHRDVQPENVLWDPEKERALLVDFGIAALLSTTGEDVTRLTKHGQLVGDVRYMSPEQLQDEDLTVLVDIYSFGVMAYELLTGDGPYEARDRKEQLSAHLTAEPKDLRALRPDLDPNVAAVLRRCLNKEPRHRPAASDVLRALQGEWRVDPRPMPILENPIVRALLDRRVPQWLGAGSVVAGSIVGGVATLNQEYPWVPEWAFTVALVTGAAVVAASGTLGWFHGALGAQRGQRTEYLLLGALFTGWLVATATIIATWG